MIVRFSPRPEDLQRLQVGPIGPHLPSFATLVSQQGYCSVTGWLKVRLVAKLSRWLQQHQVPLSELNETQVAAFFKARWKRLKRHVGELNGGTITSSKEQVSEVAVRECMPAPVPAGTLLFSFKLSIGKMAVAGCPLYTNEAIAALPIHNPKQLSRDFLRYALMSESREGDADAAVLGKLLNKEKVREISVPVPPLAEQERIVKLLDEADEFRKLRAQADRRTAALIPALFHETLGDSDTIANRWPTRPLGLLVTDGPQNGLYKHSSHYGDGTPILRIDAFYDGEIHDTATLKRLRVTPEELQRYQLRDYDLLINTLISCGTQKRVIEVTPDQKIAWQFTAADAPDGDEQVIALQEGGRGVAQKSLRGSPVFRPEHDSRRFLGVELEHEAGEFLDLVFFRLVLLPNHFPCGRVETEETLRSPISIGGTVRAGQHDGVAVGIAQP